MNLLRRVAFELILVPCFVAAPAWAEANRSGAKSTSLDAAATVSEPTRQPNANSTAQPAASPPGATSAPEPSEPARPTSWSQAQSPAAPEAAPRAPAAPEAAPRAPAAPETAAPETAPPETAPPETAPPETAPPEAAPRAAAAMALPPSNLRRPTLGWDVNLEGGYGRYYADPARRFGLIRMRGGLLYSSDPVFYALGLTYEWSNLTAATFGVQAEAMHIESGLWAQAGGLLDVQAHPGAMASVGWSVLGAELQYRKFDPNDWGMVLIGKIRIPITFVAEAFK